MFIPLCFSIISLNFVSPRLFCDGVYFKAIFLFSPNNFPVFTISGLVFER